MNGNVFLDSVHLSLEDVMVWASFCELIFFMVHKIASHQLQIFYSVLIGSDIRS
jgi:hypothetical protein